MLLCASFLVCIVVLWYFFLLSLGYQLIFSYVVHFNIRVLFALSLHITKQKKCNGKIHIVTWEMLNLQYTYYSCELVCFEKSPCFIIMPVQNKVIILQKIWQQIHNIVSIWVLIKIKGCLCARHGVNNCTDGVWECSTQWPCLNCLLVMKKIKDYGGWHGDCR